MFNLLKAHPKFKRMRRSMCRDKTNATTTSFNLSFTSTTLADSAAISDPFPIAMPRCALAKNARIFTQASLNAQATEYFTKRR